MRSVLRLCAVCLFFFASLALATPPPLMLANSYRPGIPLEDYWVSEKLDGVRAYWDGRRLVTRGGHAIASPAWFTAGWPAQPLDGELWAGRGTFGQVSSVARLVVPDDAAWRAVRFMVFDLPAHPAVFDERLRVLNGLLAGQDASRLQAVRQFRVKDHAALVRELERVVKAGGEGLMLHRGASSYRALRSDDLLKLKPQEDAEAVVVAHLPGKGKYAGLTGALLVEMPTGQRFRLGSGLSDAQRRQPPAPGRTVTYRYRGFHESGIPRFATFLRERERE